MSRFNRGAIQTFKQERLAKEDIRLLLQMTELAKDYMMAVRLDSSIPKVKEYPSDTRIELLLGKLKRMEKQG